MATAAASTNHSIVLMDLAEDWKVGDTTLTEPHYWGVGGGTGGNNISWGLLNWTMYGVRLDVDGKPGTAITASTVFASYNHEATYGDETNWWSTATDNKIILGGTMLANACHVKASSM